MARLLSSNAHTSSNLNTIHLKISTHAYFTVLFHSKWSKYKNSKIDFYDVTTLVLHCLSGNDVTSLGWGWDRIRTSYFKKTSKIFPKPNSQIYKTIKHMFIWILKIHKNRNNASFNAMFCDFLVDYTLYYKSKMNK